MVPRLVPQEPAGRYGPRPCISRAELRDPQRARRYLPGFAAGGCWGRRGLALTVSLSIAVRTGAAFTNHIGFFELLPFSFERCRGGAELGPIGRAWGPPQRAMEGDSGPIVSAVGGGRGLLSSPEFDRRSACRPARNGLVDHGIRAPSPRRRDLAAAASDGGGHKNWSGSV